MKQQNQNQNQTKYIPPLVLDHMELETESPILTGSGGGLPFENNVKTNSQVFSEMEFVDGGDYNTSWRQF